tara:strand:+ start:1642 stop:1773 length:132 start_codon:yes stop_codon:yes gene_type:complete
MATRMAGEKSDELAKACWKDYEAFGFKMKDGEKVPDCKPKKKG